MRETPALSDFTVTAAKRGAFRYLYHRPKCSKLNPANVVEVGDLTVGVPVEPAGCCTPPAFDFTGAVTRETQAEADDLEAIAKAVGDAIDEAVKSCPSCGRVDVVRNGLVGAHACDGLERKRSAKGNGASAKGRPVKQSVVFTVDGKPMIRARRWTLGYMAAECTKGLGPKGSGISTADLRKVLAKAGVDEPETTEWSTELANGVTVGAVSEAKARKLAEVSA